MMTHRKRISIALVTAIVAVSAIYFFATRDVTTPNAFKAVTVGMRSTEVISKLGEPDTRAVDAEGLTVFYYGEFKKSQWRTTQVTFSEDMTVARKLHD